MSGYNHPGVVGHTGNQLVFGPHTTSKLYLIIGNLAVLVHIYITVAGTGLLHDGQIGYNHIVFGSEVKRGAGKHSGTYPPVFIGEFNLYRKSTGVRVYCRIHQTDIAFKGFVSVDIQLHGYRSAFLHLGKVSFGNIDKQLHRHNLLYHQHGFAAAVHIAAVIVSGSYNTVYRTEQRGILQQIAVGRFFYVQRHLGCIPLRFGCTAHFIQFVHTLELNLLIIQLELCLFQVCLIHADQLLTFGHAVAHFHQYPVDAYRRGRSYVVLYLCFYGSCVLMNLLYRTCFYIRQLHSRLFVHLLNGNFIFSTAASAQQCYCKQGNQLKTFLHIVVLVLFLITDDIVSSQYLVKVGLSHQVVIYGLVVSKLRLGELNLRSIQFEYRTLAHFITLAGNLHRFFGLHHILLVTGYLLRAGCHIILVACNLHVQLTFRIDTVLVQLAHLDAVGFQFRKVACLI